MSPPIRLLVWAMALSASLPAQAELQFERCTVNGTQDTVRLLAQCATFPQPLNPAEPEGEQIELKVVRFPSTAQKPATDPLLVINGGPGGSSIELSVDLHDAFSLALRERDVLVMDQRGTGLSHALTCDEALSGTDEIPPEPESPEFAELVQTCIEQAPFDPRFFTTSVAVRDIEALRQAAGYAQLNLYGVSYGTRVALHFARRYPDATRSLIIDGIVPPTVALGAMVANNGQQTLDAVLQRCAEDDACSEAFPNLAQQLQNIRESLSEQPQAVELAHPITGEPTEMELHYQHVAITLRLMNYAPETAALVPLLIHLTAQQNYLPVAAQAIRLTESLTDSLASGMHNSVVCAEDVPFFGPAEADLAALEKTFLGSEQVRALSAICRLWPRGPMDDEFKAPLSSAVPTLALSGEYDPITPPRYGAQVTEGLTNARHLIAPGQGHGVFARGCTARIAMDFVRTLNPEELEVDCLAHLGTYPFFLNTLGPKP